MKRRRITLNLTALLDVILLMLFAYQINALQSVQAEPSANLEQDEEAPQPGTEPQGGKAQEGMAANETVEALHRASTAKLSERDILELERLQERWQERSENDRLQELAELSSYQEFIASWRIALVSDRGYGRGLSLLRVEGEDDLSLSWSLGGTPEELSERLSSLLGEELLPSLRKTQRLVVIRIEPDCEIYKENRRRFLSALDQVLAQLATNPATSETEFIVGKEEPCRNQRNQTKPKN